MRTRAALQGVVKALEPLRAEGWALHWAGRWKFAEMTRRAHIGSASGAFYYARDGVERAASVGTGVGEIPSLGTAGVPSLGENGACVCWKIGADCPFGWALRPTTREDGTKDYSEGCCYFRVGEPEDTAQAEIPPPILDTGAPSEPEHGEGILTQLLVGDIYAALEKKEGVTMDAALLVDKSQSRLLHHDAPLVSVLRVRGEIGHDDWTRSGPDLELDLLLSDRSTHRARQPGMRAYQAFRTVRPIRLLIREPRRQAHVHR